MDTEVGLEKMDLKISRIDGEDMTEYKVSYVNKSVGTALKMPKGLSTEQEKLFKELVKAQKSGDMLYLFEKALQTFDLPEEFSEYPDVSTHELLAGMFESPKNNDGETELEEAPY